MNIQDIKMLVILVAMCCAIMAFYYSEMDRGRLAFTRNKVLYLENPAAEHGSSSTNCTYCINHRIYKPVISPDQTYDIVLLITSSHRKDAAERR